MVRGWLPPSACNMAATHRGSTPWMPKSSSNLLRHADHERATMVPAGASKAVNQLPLKSLKDGLSVCGQHTEQPFWFAPATSHHGDALLHKADRAASQDTMLQNVPPGPRHAVLIVAGNSGHRELRTLTMQTLGAVAQRAQHSGGSAHRGHTPLGTVHASAYVHAQDLTAAATNHRTRFARDGQTPVQIRLRIRKERLSGVSFLPKPCLSCGGAEGNTYARGLHPLGATLAIVPQSSAICGLAPLAR